MRIDRRFDNPYRLTQYAKRVITTWVVVVIVAIILMGATHGGLPSRLASHLLAMPGTGCARGGESSRQTVPRCSPQPQVRFGAPAFRFRPSSGVVGAQGRLDAAAWLAAGPILAPGTDWMAVLGPGRPGAGWRAEHQVHPSKT